MRRSALRLPVTERTQAAEARRLAVELARAAGFSETKTGEVAIIATEVGNNLAAHARDGELIISAVEDVRGTAVEIISVDRGPGMDTSRSLVDGYSTAGTSGTGLGAIRRLSSAFDVYSDQHGTVLFSRVERDSREAFGSVFGSVRVPKQGELDCGDNWSLRTTPQGIALLVSDGLGHGEFAAEASDQAVGVFQNETWTNAAGAIEGIHLGLRGTRGAAVAVAEACFDDGFLRFCGLGNIAGLIVGPSTIHRLVSHNGTAGHNAARIASFQYPWTPESVLIMHSDGLGSHWNPDRYPGLRRWHPAVSAGMIYREHNRGRDDTTIVIGRHGNRHEVSDH